VVPFVASTFNGVVVHVPTPGVVHDPGVAAEVWNSGKPRLEEKSPARCAAVGTMAVLAVVARRMRRASSEKKKKVLFFALYKAGPPSPNRSSVIGPLTVPPKVL
jgi:hypothetical protein